jgi:SAM-dependent methyltransferase
MRRFAFPLPFDLITIPFRPFQHLTTTEDQLKCLACIRRHLLPGGRLILDIFNPWLELLVADDVGTEASEGPPFTMPDGRTVERRFKFASKDRTTQVNQIELIYCITHPDGRKERFVHSFAFRYLFRFEAEHLLVRAGFKVDQLYSDYDRSPFGAKYPGELIFIARGS